MSNRPPELQVAAWPALMTTDLACAYLQLSEQSFRWLAKARGVKPRECAGLALTRWRRSDLDDLVDSLPERGREIELQEPSNESGLTQPSADRDPAAHALARAAQRARKAGGSA